MFLDTNKGYTSSKLLSQKTQCGDKKQMCDNDPNPNPHLRWTDF